MQKIIMIDGETYLHRTLAADRIDSTPGTMGNWQSRGIKPFKSIIHQGRAYYRQIDLDDYVKKSLTISR